MTDSCSRVSLVALFTIPLCSAEDIGYEDLYPLTGSSLGWAFKKTKQKRNRGFCCFCASKGLVLARAYRFSYGSRSSSAQQRLLVLRERGLRPPLESRVQSHLTVVHWWINYQLVKHVFLFICLAESKATEGKELQLLQTLCTNTLWGVHPH